LLLLLLLMMLLLLLLMLLLLLLRQGNICNATQMQCSTHAVQHVCSAAHIQVNCHIGV